MTLEDRTHHPVPRRVFLFSGHMIDAKGRPTPRFPPEKEPIAATAIAQTLNELSAGPEDLGITQGACGGDLLFSSKNPLPSTLNYPGQVSQLILAQGADPAYVTPHIQFLFVAP